jgi:hypothetical protein
MEFGFLETIASFVFQPVSGDSFKILKNSAGNFGTRP